MKRDLKGFTLIELIAVIVVIGVLAAVAAPKFVNLVNSAKTSAIQGVATALEGVITQVQAKAYVKGLVPSTSNPGGTVQTDYIIDFGIGSVEVDWGTLCPESRGESADALNMVDFLTLDTAGAMTSDFGNRHTVVGYDYSFSSGQLNSSNIVTLPAGCYVLYDSFGGRTSGDTCPTTGCVCTVRIETSTC